MRLEHPDISIHGIADIVSQDKVVELKFSNEYGIMQGLQAYFYWLIDAAKSGRNAPNCLERKPKQLQVFNMRTGILYTLIPNRETPLMEVLLSLSEVTGLKLRNRAFVYDLETQGLDKHTHEIVQRHVVDFSTRSVVSSGFLNFPLNDQIKELTHIREEQL